MDKGIISMIPYGKQYVDRDDWQAIEDVLASDWLTTGPKAEEFEKAIADYVGAKYAVAVSSGTAALHAAMYAIGIKPGDEVIIPPITFAATANCIVYQGGLPVFVDVDPDTLLIDSEKIEEKITTKTKAIIAVDYAGQPCDYDRLIEIADRHDLILVVDACHSLGAEYKGQKAGSLADLNVFSFHPVKAITTGEGGMITTDNEEYADFMYTFRNHGMVGGTQYALGYNYRITDIQCALGISQLKKLPWFLERRRDIAQQYDDQFMDSIDVTTEATGWGKREFLISELIPGIRPLAVKSNVLHAYHLYVVKIDFKSLGINPLSFQDKLLKKGIGTQIHYRPAYCHPFYRNKFGMRLGLCPNAEEAYGQILSLPMFPGMTGEDAEHVIVSIRELLVQERGK